MSTAPERRAGSTWEAGGGCKRPRTTQGSESSPVVVAGVILQQQLLGEADLLQLLAQFVQLTGQLLALQLLQHQVLQGQREDECGTGAQKKRPDGPATGPPRG